jgi:hypothetical protein
VTLGASTSSRSLRQIRIVVLALILADLLLIGGQAAMYRPLFGQPGAGIYVLEPVVMLVIYAVAAYRITAALGDAQQPALRESTMIGLVGGLLFITNLGLETFVDLPAPANLVSTAPIFIGTFVLWGFAAYRAARLTRSTALGVTATIWSAMCTILLTITFGFALAYVALPRLEQNLAGSPEFVRSGWRDLHAFAIANQFDAAFSHLLVAIVIAAVVGTLGSSIRPSAGAR